MPDESIPDHLFKHFLNSDPLHWVRFVPALPMQAAYYYDHLDDAALQQYLLHLTNLGGTWRIVLEVGTHDFRFKGLMFNAVFTEREIELRATGSDVADAEWPALGEALIRKSHEIALSCRNRYGPPPVDDDHSYFH